VRPSSGARSRHKRQNPRHCLRRFVPPRAPRLCVIQDFCVRTAATVRSNPEAFCCTLGNPYKKSPAIQPGFVCMASPRGWRGPSMGRVPSGLASLAPDCSRQSGRTRRGSAYPSDPHIKKARLFSRALIVWRPQGDGAGHPWPASLRDSLRSRRIAPGNPVEPGGVLLHPRKPIQKKPGYSAGL